MSEEKKIYRTAEETKDLTVRLNRIEGQIRGIKNMLERGDYCVDIMTQVAAANAALNSFNKELLSRHLHSCVVKDVQAGNLETIDELSELIKKVMK